MNTIGQYSSDTGEFVLVFPTEVMLALYLNMNGDATDLNSKCLS